MLGFLANDTIEREKRRTDILASLVIELVRAHSDERWVDTGLLDVVTALEDDLRLRQEEWKELDAFRVKCKERVSK